MMKFTAYAVVALLLLLLLAACSRRDTPHSESAAAEPAPLVDPNCQVNVVGGAAIPNYFGAPSPAQFSDATDAIAQLTFGDLYRNPPFSIPSGLVRLDVQGAIGGGGRNWQVQINGIAGHSTISTMLIDGAVGHASAPGLRAADGAQRAESEPEHGQHLPRDGLL
jgi:hypothetical protein